MAARSEALAESFELRLYCRKLTTQRLSLIGAKRGTLNIT
jgi:hypothetical protein